MLTLAFRAELARFAANFSWDAKLARNDAPDQA